MFIKISYDGGWVVDRENTSGSSSVSTTTEYAGNGNRNGTANDANKLFAS